MLPTPALKRTAGSAENRRSDPRLHPRYPISLDLQYKILRGRHVEHFGGGRTLNISSGGVLFETSDFPEAADVAGENGTVELALDWPLLLQKVCAMKLIVRGRIVRRDSKTLALKIEQHEFRTAGVKARGSFSTVLRGTA
jgi:hypothetical protein